MKLSEISALFKDEEREATSTVSSTLEREYSFFGKVDVAKLVTGFKNDHEVTSQVFIEASLGGDRENGKLRLRHFPNKTKQSTTKLERKLKISEMESIEETVEIPVGFLKPLLLLSQSITARVRYFVPAKTPSGVQIKYKDGTLLMWQIDLFMDTLNPDDNLDLATISPWVKIELEVRDIVLDVADVQDAIPIECEQVIDARTKDDSERQLIDALYSTVYNLNGKTMEQPQLPPAETAPAQDTPASTGDNDDDDFDFNGKGEPAPVTEPEQPAEPAEPAAEPDNDDDFDFEGKGDKPAEPAAEPTQPTEPPEPAKPETDDNSSSDEFQF